GCTTSTSPNGSTVISLALTPEARGKLPPDQRVVDLFVLGPRNQLGRHSHRHSSAHVHFVSGHGVAELDDAWMQVGPGDALFFPALSVHNVRSGEETVLFASFQDHPILQPDGSADYYPAED